MADAPYFKQVEQKINYLIADKKLSEAFKLVNSMIKKFPEEKLFYDIRKKVIFEIESHNNKIVEEKMKEVKPLWKKKSYAEILKKLKPLLKITPSSERLKKDIIKAQERYQEEVNRLRQDFKNKQTVRLTKLMDEDEKTFLQELFELERANPGNKDVLSLTKHFRDRLIQRKIKERQDLIYSDKYDAIENFLVQLRKIDEKSERISKLQRDLYNRKRGSIMEEKSEFVFNALTHLNTLMRLKKYDKALQVSKEIIEVDKTNQDALKAYKKAKNKLYHQTRGLSIEAIQKDKPKIEADYQKDPTKFKKI